MVHLILRPTPIGVRAFPIESLELSEGLKAGTIKMLPDGMYQETEPAPRKAEQDDTDAAAPAKRKYSRKDMTAQ